VKKNNSYAFTLVELIVVIMILAILGTIGFLSFQNYAQGARNSARISDMRVINKAMSLLDTTWYRLPLPDLSIDVSYSGGLAWKQWVFATGALAQLRKVSNAPTDPLFWNYYTYSLSSNERVYQFAAALEWSAIYAQNIFSPETYALSANNFYAYTFWNRLSYDTPVISGGDCRTIATPSIILSDIPASATLINNSNYKYTYNKSNHLPNSYSWSIIDIGSSSWFQTVELLDSCNINTIWELELYIAKLSTAYISYSHLDEFENLIFNSNSLKFQLFITRTLESQWINVADSVMAALESPTPDYAFVDTFTNPDGTDLLSGHLPTSSGSWIMLWSWGAWAYEISGNTLEKNWSTNTLISILPNPLITNNNYSMSFDIEDFASGDISAYLRYTDSDNYYRLTVSQSWYELIRRLLWVDSTVATIVDPISTGSTISFSVSGDSLIFGVNGIEKENRLVWDIDATWNPAILLENDGANIDNYTLTYK
jgi:prepilin-type N-terminal cleavage/methylation domain-containing protein